MKYYHMIVENIHTGERREYINKRQGATTGREWKCIGVCGYHEKQEDNNNGRRTEI